MHCARCSQGKLYALTVADVADVPVLTDVVTPQVSWAALAEAETWTEAKLSEAVQERLDREVAEIRAAGVEAEAVVRIGVPWREILAAGQPAIGVGEAIILLVVGVLAGLLGGLIGTGGCSVMLPSIHFWMGASWIPATRRGCATATPIAANPGTAGKLGKTRWPMPDQATPRHSHVRLRPGA
ncbi:MAG: hypothetical protein ACP5SI_11105, partial [Chloroflexia bacterium]